MERIDQHEQRMIDVFKQWRTTFTFVVHLLRFLPLRRATLAHPMGHKVLLRALILILHSLEDPFDDVSFVSL